jgi:serine/threonine protein kinase
MSSELSLTSSEQNASLPYIPSYMSCFQQTMRQNDGDLDLSINRDQTNRLFRATIGIATTYKNCNPSFKSIEVLPQRVLTNPSEGVLNNGFDNQDANLICRVHDKLLSGDKVFTILDLLGTGTFGQVFRCKREDTKEIFAVKVIKNKPAYHTQGMLEIKIAKLLNGQYDPHNEKHIVRLLESFEYQHHICLVFELLSMSLLDLLTQNQFRGLPLSVVQRFTKQLLTALMVLEDANILHCDLKPENILLVSSNQKSLLKRKKSSKGMDELPESGGSCHRAVALTTALSTTAQEATGDLATTKTQQPSQPQEKKQQSSSSRISDIKVIDFGSACFEGRTIYSYIQSRFCKYTHPLHLLCSMQCILI